MELSLVAVAAGLMVMFSLAAVYAVSYTYERYKRTSIGWAAILVAFCFMVLERLAIFIYDAGVMPDELVKVVITPLFIVTTLAFLVGAWKVKEVSDKYDLVERERLATIDRRIRRFEKNRKRS